MIAGIGFARMAWELAHVRRGYKPVTGIDYEPNPRASPDFPCHKQACLDCEYYRIIDLAERLWLFRDHNWTTQVKL
jgi:hypothetical protein